MAQGNGFKVTDEDGNLLATYANQSEVETFLRASFGDKFRTDAVVGVDDKTHVFDENGDTLAFVSGKWSIV